MKENITKWLIILVLGLPALLVFNLDPEKIWVNFVGLAYLFILSRIFRWDKA